MKSGPYVDVMTFNENVTGSCNLCVVKFNDGTGVKFLVDCGQYQERGDNEALNSTIPFNAESIKFVLCTHAHMDHIGNLPLLVRKGFSNPIYATTSTCKFIPLALADSCKILANNAKKSKKAVIYSEANVDSTILLLKHCDFGKTQVVYENLDNKIQVTFLQNGHLIGAALILVQICCEGCDSIDLIFSGDFNNKNKFFKPIIPRWLFGLPATIIQESTYGYMDSTEIKPCFNHNVVKCLKMNGTVVVLASSLEKAQSMLQVLKNMQDSEELNTDVPIYLDGKLAIKYTHLFLNEELGISKEKKEFLPQNFHLVGKNERKELCNDYGRKIIVTTSGMGSYGPAQTYIPEFIVRKNSLIQFTGYTAEGTLGYQLQNVKNGEKVKIGGKEYIKEAEVKYTTEFSAHAKADEMISFLRNFERVNAVLLNHGEREVKKQFAERISKEVETEKVEILGNGYVYRISAYGIIKKIRAKCNQ